MVANFDDEALGALRRSEEQYARAFLQNPVPMTITNAETGRFVAVNEEFLRLVGYWRAEVIGRTSAELGLWPEYGERARVADVLEAGSAVGPVVGGVRAKSGEVVNCTVWFRLLRMTDESSVLSVLVPVHEVAG